MIYIYIPLKNSLRPDIAIKECPRDVGETNRAINDQEQTL
jgi:hypothetical protein